MNTKIRELLTFIYGEDVGKETETRLEALVSRRMTNIAKPSNCGEGMLPLDEKDAFVITYGDQFQKKGQSQMKTLGEFFKQETSDFLSGVHILPFFPYTSDDGFSIVDYMAVNPDWGDWDDVEGIGRNFKLMSDLVLNHCSASSEWFKSYLACEGKYKEYFIDIPEDTDVSMVFRPRALPLLTAFDTAEGKKHVWTTFSADQVDLNFGNPDIMLEMIDVFLFHVQKGIQVIRLDAIAYLWKELGHSCLHHPKTHAAVQLFRAVVDEFVPWVVIITETNVPHKENISYFGSGTDEAQMIYQFALPPMVLDAFLREDAGHMKAWASELPQPDGRTTYFNFLASHDGVGLLPARGILTDDELEGLIESVKDRGGLISYKATATGDVPYEMNVNYCDAVAEKDLPAEDRARKFLASQSILLGFPGVPGIYVHSLIGSGNWKDGVSVTGMNRTINRQKLDFDEVTAELADPSSFRSHVFSGYRRMLAARRQNMAFHPASAFNLVSSSESVLAFERESDETGDKVLCLVNLSSKKQEQKLGNAAMRDIITDTAILPGSSRFTSENILLEPWEVLWLIRE